MNLDFLPPEIQIEILLHLPLADLLGFCASAKRFQIYCLDESFWRAKLERDYPAKAKRIPKPNNTTWKEYYKEIFLSTYRSPISIGDDHYGIIKDGNLWLGGGSSYGKRGVDPSIDKNKLNKLSFSSPVTYINCTEHSTGVVTKDGTIYIFGLVAAKIHDIVGKMVKITSLSAKFITVTDSVYGVISGNGSVFIQIEDKSWKIDEIKAKHIALSEINLTHINVGIITENGDLFVYQLNSNSNKINRWNVKAPEPISIVKMKGTHLSNITYVALSDSGNVYTWGFNMRGQLGLGHYWDITIPTKIDLPKIKSIDINASRTVGAVTEDGKIYLWGSNTHNLIILMKDIHLIPDPYFNHGGISIPIEISLGNKEKIIDISIGRSVIIALTETEKIKMFGRRITKLQNALSILSAEYANPVDIVLVD